MIAIENASALFHKMLEISKRSEAQMIRHMRHGSPPRLMALQPILSPNRRECLPTPSAGVRIRARASKYRLSWDEADPGSCGLQNSQHGRGPPEVEQSASVGGNMLMGTG